MDDWKNLKRMLLWVKETIDDKRIIQKSLAYVYTWIYVAYMLNIGTRSHTRWDIFMGHRVLHEK